MIVSILMLVGLAVPSGVYSDNYRPLDFFVKSLPNVIHYDDQKKTSSSVSVCGSAPSGGSACQDMPIVNVNVPSVKEGVKK